MLQFIENISNGFIKYIGFYFMGYSK